MNEILNYLNKTFTSLKPEISGFFAVVWSGVNYLLWPDATFKAASISVLICIVLDILTKYWSLSRDGGLIKAFKNKVINSNTFFVKTARKLIVYMIVLILCGASYRLTPVAGISIITASIIYSIMFLRECMSVLENLRDGGISDFNWLLDILRRKEKQILNNTEDEQGNDNTPTI